MLPLSSELKRTSGVFAETAWAGAAYYLLLYMLASHIVGAFWYLLAVERNDSCWQRACAHSGNCKTDFLYCSNRHTEGYDAWLIDSDNVLNSNCSVEGDNPPFNYGIYTNALSSGIVSSKKFLSKYCYCLWWGLQNLRQCLSPVICMCEHTRAGASNQHLSWRSNILYSSCHTWSHTLCTSDWQHAGK
ncbi:putative cyclic nucleotide-gated ion channel 5 [Vitis vinifera]|uniref:Putative cyclic nucleotide-gated ion channel 5 n=1 Tax=Vitis vinifera TaxID=29760 RepID=A0A438IHE3_VITVI|nr:putative cyclic nucleotide-gated ion channel 5 [Vitis vinifera]